MSEEESRVVRIVNLDETFTNETLKTFILTRCQPNGDIKNLYLKRDDINKIFYGYIVFEHTYDAVKVIQCLNGYVHGTNQFEIELIGPNLKYRIFPSEIEYPLKSAISTRSNLLCRRSVFGAAGGRRMEKVSGLIIPKLNPKVDAANKPPQPGMSYANIYISNIHYSMTESGLAKLVNPFGPWKKLYLAKNKETGCVRGFAYVNFKFRCDAAEAISQLNGINYGDRILKVEWSRSQANTNFVMYNKR